MRHAHVAQGNKHRNKIVRKHKKPIVKKSHAVVENTAKHVLKAPHGKAKDQG